MIADPNTGQSSKQVLSSTKKGHIYIVPIGNPFVDRYKILFRCFFVKRFLVSLLLLE